MIYLSDSVPYGLFLVLISCSGTSSQEVVTDYESSNKCLPQLADRCFAKFSTNLECHGTTCYQPDQLCRLLEDSLQCSSDIIDSDCSISNGTEKFDSWLKGLQAMYSYVCPPESPKEAHKPLNPFFRNTECWNKKLFIKCVGEMLNIHHVVDMLRTPYDYNECIRMIIAMTSCNVNARTSCADFHEAFINDLIYIFFSQQKCNDFNTELNFGVKFAIPSANYVFTSVVTTILFNRF